MNDTLQRLFSYKASANDELLNALAELGAESPITKLAIKALSHTYVVDRIFAAHLRRNGHGYVSAIFEPNADARRFVSRPKTKRSGVC
jgi:uncharacterized damage-inducible protein DinB